MKTSTVFLSTHARRILAAATTGLALVSTASAASYEWTFDNGDLSVSLGNGVMLYADGAATQGQTSFGTTGAGAPHINGQAAKYIHFPGFTDPANGYNLIFNDSGPNGGGAYINQYTFIFDLLSPGTINWTPFFNTNPDNANDADFYISDTGQLGIGGLGYSAAGVIAADTWYRIAFAADLGAGNVSYYVNGASVRDRTGSSLLDGRHSLYSNADPAPPTDVRLFNEGDASGVYTHELYVNSIYFTDRTLSAAEIMALGGPSAVGIVVPEPGSFALLALGVMLGGWIWQRSRC